MPVEEVGTDRERLLTWSKKAAIEANKVVRAFGLERYGLVEAEPSGYIAAFLDGIWLRAPYLHNGSVPSLWELLKPPKDRVSSFKVGSRQFDPKNVGWATEESPFRAKYLDLALKHIKGHKEKLGVSRQYFHLFKQT